MNERKSGASMRQSVRRCSTPSALEEGHAPGCLGAGDTAIRTAGGCLEGRRTSRCCAGAWGISAICKPTVRPHRRRLFAPHRTFAEFLSMPETVESRGIPVLGKDILEWSFWGWTVKITLLAESVTGHPFNRLLSDLFNDFGATSAGSIALTVDGTPALRTALVPHCATMGFSTSGSRRVRPQELLRIDPEPRQRSPRRIRYRQGPRRRPRNTRRLRIAGLVFPGA